MQTSNADKYGSSNNPEWQFLAELPLSEFLPDHDHEGKVTAGPLFQTIREWGIPREYLENMDRTLTGFAREVGAHFRQGSLELPGRIRVFCQKKVIDDANSTKTARPDHAEQTMEQAPIPYPSGTIMNGGWGYYVIERGRDFTSHPCKESCRVIELYMYKEGK